MTLTDTLAKDTLADTLAVTSKICLLYIPPTPKTNETVFWCLFPSAGMADISPLCTSVVSHL